MTRWEVIKQWPLDILIHWLILIEKRAIENTDVINKMSEEDLKKDWYEFLMEEEE